MLRLKGRRQLRPSVRGQWIVFLLVAISMSAALPAAADGQISGRVTDENGDAVPQARVEIYAEDGTLVETYISDGGGLYLSQVHPSGTYYVFLWSGSATQFIGWFGEWYNGAPWLRPDQAQGVIVGNGPVTGINAQLEPLFDDMFDSEFEESIGWMHDTGITQGCSLVLYCPDDFVTRGQMAAFLVRALLLTDDGGGNLYTDDDDSVFEGVIDRLGTAGVTRGCNPPVNNRFCPDDLVTRGQMAAFLVRALGYVDDGGGNLFTDDDGSVFEEAIDRLGTAGVTLGCNPPANDRFCPNSNVTRGQMAAFLNRALDEYYPLGTLHLSSFSGGKSLVN